MLTIALLLLQELYASGCGSPAVKPDINRVVNGEDARPHSWPWQFTLVAPRWVLTAGHCIWPGDVYRVVLGEHDMSQQEGTEQTRDILRIVEHPEWDIDHVSDGNDLALLKLDKSPIMTDSVSVACLSELEEILPHGLQCFISGWGNLYTHGPMPDRLQQALLPVVEHSVCSRSDWWGINVRPTMVCAGGDVVSGCNGSGGPLNCLGEDGKWYIHGVTTFVSSRSCNEVKKPTVFTRTSAFYKWLGDEGNVSVDGISHHQGQPGVRREFELERVFLLSDDSDLSL